MNTFGTGRYVSVTITGNLLTLNGGTSSNNLALDNVSLAVIAGNFFGCGGACTTFTGILLGSHTTVVNVQSNAYDSSYTMHVHNLGTSNTIGGASN